MSANAGTDPFSCTTCHREFMQMRRHARHICMRVYLPAIWPPSSLPGVTLADSQIFGGVRARSRADGRAAGADLLSVSGRRR